MHMFRRNVGRQRCPLDFLLLNVVRVPVGESTDYFRKGDGSIATDELDRRDLVLELIDSLETFHGVCRFECASFRSNQSAFQEDGIIESGRWGGPVPLLDGHLTLKSE